MKFTKTFSLVGCIAALICSQIQAQDTPSNDVVAASAEKATLEKALVANIEDGVLKGNVFTDVEGVKTPLAANVTLTSEGVVVDTVETDKSGSFSFEGIEPGSYQILGSSDGYIGGQAYDVQPFTGSVGGCSTCSVGLQSVESSCSSCAEAAYQAPASACGCGGGGGGGGGGLLGGGGGGILGGRRLLALGGVGAIIAVAVSDDDDDDDMVSADE